MVSSYVDTSVIYPEIRNNPTTIYSFLLSAGYLKVVKKDELHDGNAICDIAIPNKEIFYVYEKEIDTVVCLDGSEVIGTFLARQLSQKNLFSLSSEKNVCVVTPEHDSNGLLIFRNNLRPMVSEKNVLLLISTVNSGKTAARALECIEYYGGTTQGVAAVFSALKQVGDIPVISLFSPEDIPGYVTSLVKDCPMCKAGQKIDALSNSYGFSPLT